MKNFRFVMLIACMNGFANIPNNAFVLTDETFSETESVNPTIQYEESTILTEFSKNADVILCFKEASMLHDSQMNQRYCYIPFKEHGYLVFDVLNNVICEFSDSKDNEIQNIPDDCLYAGPGAFYSETEHGYLDLLTNEEILCSKQDFLNSLLQIESQEIQIPPKRNQSRIPRIARAATTKHVISGNVPNYRHNPDSRCGATAAAMLLRWYDLYRNNKYVPKNLESNGGEALINRLWDMIKSDNYSGAYPGMIYTQMMKFLRSQGVTHAGGLDGYTNEYVIGRVDSYGTPFILNLWNHPVYRDHYVTGYGYYSDSTGFYPIVNDGHGRQGVKIHSNYATTIIW